MSPGSGPTEQLLDELRPVSFAIAYRMLGSVAEAEDVVQESLLRVHRAVEAGERIDSPRAFVATITTRLAIDELRSARARRERYVGEWLPEPILTDSLDDPAEHAEIADSLSMAMLVLLETLSPEQRAVLLLRDVFDYGYGEIAAIVGKNEDNVRQLASRARAHVEAGRPRFQTSREQVPALARPLQGRKRVARALVNWTKLGARIAGATVRPVEVNGMPGALLLDGEDRLLGVWALEIAGGEIRGVNSIVNPAKIGHLGPVADLNALLAPPRALRPEPPRGAGASGT
jgi:RNA polymerase sigma factor (sigma-70 family)